MFNSFFGYLKNVGVVLKLEKTEINCFKMFLKMAFICFFKRFSTFFRYSKQLPGLKILIVVRLKICNLTKCRRERFLPHHHSLTSALSNGPFSRPLFLRKSAGICYFNCCSAKHHLCSTIILRRRLDGTRAMFSC